MSERTAAEPAITCPQCGTEIKLTESLAAPLVAAAKKEYEKRLADKIREQDALIAEGIARERKNIIRDEAEKAKKAAEEEAAGKLKELESAMTALKEREQQRSLKLKEAQTAQAEFLKKQQDLDDQKRELELTVQKQVAAGLESVREKAKKEAEEGLLLKVREKDETILSMTKTIEELKRKSDQGSQQMQGEVQELELEALLKDRFKTDTIEPVPKGEYGGDVLQRVITAAGRQCGTIIWESKRTKAWSDGWLVKLREDQRAAKADIPVLLSQVLPKGILTFDCVDGVWVTGPGTALPLAAALRQSLMELSLARSSSEGVKTKAEMVYEYLTGPRFRQRVQAIVEAFTSMKGDLDREKKVISKQWAKREEQIERVMQSTVGMYGDLQGIAGKPIEEIEGLGFEALEEPEE
ncbi:MAG: DUF2130 domain-containing protein [Spirochaetales bacterium]|nr:MAG: DUF2130 domain-containing protein [Spirochaetales bacterium]